MPWVDLLIDPPTKHELAPLDAKDGQSPPKFTRSGPLGNLSLAIVACKGNIQLYSMPASLIDWARQQRR